MLTDMKAMSDRISQGDGMLAKRVVATAILKGNKATREKIMQEITFRDLKGYPLSLILDWSMECLRLKGQIEPAYLYEQMEQYIQTEVMDSGRVFIDRLWNSPLPTLEELRQAIEDTKNNEVTFYEATWQAVVALFKGEKVMQELVLRELSADDFDINLKPEFTWAKELLTEGEQITREGLYEKDKMYVLTELKGGYIGPLDYLLAIDMPDEALIDQAIANLKHQRQYLR